MSFIYVTINGKCCYFIGVLAVVKFVMNETHKGLREKPLLRHMMVQKLFTVCVLTSVKRMNQFALFWYILMPVRPDDLGLALTLVSSSLS